MLDTVKYLIFFIIKYDIAVFSHQFHGKCLSAQISHFIQMLDLKPHHAFQTGLVNLYDPAILDMLSEQHAEIRRRHRTLFIFLCQINKRKGCICIQGKPLLRSSRLDRQQDLILFRLCDLVDSSIQ